MVWIEFFRGNKGDIVKNFLDIEFFIVFIFYFLWIVLGFLNWVMFLKRKYR